ncbi:hypothetical protein PR003_g24264 [Phytophthora rubi]|uniref:Uncharacterized protein n=1 Tax=Phytophthora rubi TaxID=129364 RepID=A0A6A4CQC4_9STRA|nr:hypothetical protein PR001_g23535 [Phytophthora rubi]KAE9045489.1 hypothetical protein PR002_g2195 [Phytophthora rubi]KAE9294418.1 hypothetical protein PR003_g24264 [Phytophthora rubi]
MSSGIDSCSSKSGTCAFCGEHLSNTSSPIPATYDAPSDEGRGTFSKLKPLRWRFLTNKAPRTKFMCSACAEKRQKPQVIDQRPLNLDSSWSSSFETPQQREERNYKHRTVSDQALRLEHLHEPRDSKAQQQKREKLQAEQRRRLESQRRAQEQPRAEGRRRGSSQTQHGVLQPFTNHCMSRESIPRHRAAEIKARTSVPKQRASVESTTRPRKSSSGRSEPRGSEKKGQRLSSTADILGMSRSLELPPNYFGMSSSSPKFCAASAPEDSPLDWRQLEMQLPQALPRKQNETEEERQRRRSASYAHMLLRMRRHYDAVQVTNGHPATAPPRRIRPERRASVRNVKGALVKEDLIKEDDPTNASFAIDLDYLGAYKDAR